MLVKITNGNVDTYPYSVGKLRRQALRDITTHANWPNLSEADWPTKP